MPASINYDYKRPKFFISSHWETIYPAFFRKIKNLPLVTRQRIETPDADFLDLDWMKQGANKVVIIQHGLEGSSTRPYVQGMAKCFYDNGFDVLAWNFRGCSGEINKTPRFYHSGATDDLDLVVNRALDYEEIYLVGFSLGGNLTLKYLGEAKRNEKIKKAVVISVPLDLDKGVHALHTARGLIYEKRFIRNLKAKVHQKASLYPDTLKTEDLALVKTLWDFDEYFTAPLHGFDGAVDYYRKCSAKFFLKGISIPTLIINAQNDPILSRESLDMNLTKDLSNVSMELTKHGGHVGFIANHPKGYYWSEERAVKYCLEN
jgi:predicted alpha/beta-fold hydrolase